MVQNLQADERLASYESRADVSIRGEPWPKVESSFCDDLSETAPHKHLGDKTPRFTEPHGEFLYARLRAVSDYCREEFDGLVTVWITLQADEKSPDGRWYDPLEHDDGFRSDALKQALYRVRRTIDVSRRAGLWLHAPRRTGYSHRHHALWLEVPDVSEVCSEDFGPVVNTHVNNHPTAKEGNNPIDEAVKIRTGEECDGLPAEIAHNLPEIGPQTDVRSLSERWEYARIWCAMYWWDDRIRGYELGEFKDIADKAKEEKFEDAGNWNFGKGWSGT